VRFQGYELCCNFNYITLNHDLRKSDRFCACDCMDWLGACVKTTLFCSKSANMLSTSCVRTACPKLSTGLAVNNFYSCINVVDIIRLVARLFQQVRYSHDITILLQPCVVNLVTFLLYIMTASDLLEQPCNKSGNASKLVTSC
jgi:hypothetical protein